MAALAAARSALARCTASDSTATCPDSSALTRPTSPSCADSAAVRASAALSSACIADACACAVCCAAAVPRATSSCTIASCARSSWLAAWDSESACRRPATAPSVPRSSALMADTWCCSAADAATAPS
eukprot:364003-Chlamydomonas_euryale.AAC.44